jgi:hypothetical protein
MAMSAGERGDGKVTELPVSTIGTSLPWFRQHLESMGLSIPRHGALDVGLEKLGVLRDMAIAGAAFTFPRASNAAFEFFSEALGIDFLTKTLHRGVEAGLAIDKARWRHLVTDEPFIASRGKRGDGRDRLWETVVACTVATFATNVRFDEPDILCEFSGALFAVAAKFIHSDRKIGRHVRKGIRQATGRSPAAIVAANVVDLLPLDELYSKSRTDQGKSAADIADGFKDWAAGWCETPVLKSLVEELRQSKPLLIGVAFFMPFLLDWRGNPTSFFYTHMPITWGGDSEVDYEFTKSFMLASQAVSGFTGAAV